MHADAIPIIARGGRVQEEPHACSIDSWERKGDYVFGPL